MKRKNPRKKKGTSNHSDHKTSSRREPVFALYSIQFEILEFRNSHQWEYFEVEVFERYGKKCRYCRTKEDLSAIHINKMFLHQYEDVTYARVACKNCKLRYDAVSEYIDSPFDLISFNK